MSESAKARKHDHS